MTSKQFERMAAQAEKEHSAYRAKVKQVRFCCAGEVGASSHRRHHGKGLAARQP
jgi:hypothetical protein